MKNYKTLIVDDERLAREEVRRHGGRYAPRLSPLGSVYIIIWVALVCRRGWYPHFFVCFGVLLGHFQVKCVFTTPFDQHFNVFSPRASGAGGKAAI